MEIEIESYLAHIENNLHFAPKTIKSHRSKINNFYKYMKDCFSENVTPYDVTIRHILDYLNTIASMQIGPTSIYYEEGTTKTISAGAIQIYVNTLRGFYKYLQVYGDKSCCNRKLIPNQKVKKPQIEVLDDDGIAAYKSCPELIEARRDIALRNKLYITMLYVTGCRASELLPLKISDIKQHSNDLQVIGKGKKSRVVFINQEVRSILEEYLEERQKPVKTGLGVTFNPPESDYIFITLDSHTWGKPITYDRMLQYFQKYDQIMKVRPHKLRHSFATKCMRSKMHIRYVQTLLGHESILTTQRYCWVYNQDAMLEHNLVFGQ